MRYYHLVVSHLNSLYSPLNRFWFATLLVLSACFLGLGCTPKTIVISGQIIQSSGLPIDRAQVVSVPTTDIVTTDTKGYFYIKRRVIPGTSELANIGPGRYMIRVTREGYQPLEFSVMAQKGNVWANRHVMQSEQALIEKVAPEKSEVEEIAPAQAPMRGF